MRNNETPKLYVVVPCYNEEAVLPETSSRLKDKMEELISNGSISSDSHVLFVNDGSSDKTWPMIEELNGKDKLFEGVKLSKNFGHQGALLAGLSVAKERCDISISMDADLQDDINAIDEMVIKYKEGAEVVYGVRSSRKKDTFLKKFTAEGFYNLMKKMGVNLVFNHADYRLLSKLALDRLFEFDEVNLFLRGIVPQIGYKSDVVEYERNKRFAGKSKYSVKKMFSFAMDGITSFSIKPLFVCLWLGLFLSVFGFVAFITLLVLHYAINLESMWVILSAIALFSGIILAAIGVISIYVGKTYMEVKHRPSYIIEKII